MLRKNRVISTVALAAAVLVSASACSTGGATADAGAGNHGKKLVIGFLQRQLDAPYYKAMEVDAQTYAKAHGFSVTFDNANSDAVTQMNQATDLVGKGVNALVIDAVDPAAEKTFLTRISHEVPVVFEDTGIDGVGVAAVTSNNYNNGLQAGKMMGQRLISDGHKKGSTVSTLILNGGPTDTVVGPNRQSGFLAGLKAAGLNYKVEASTSATYTQDQAVPATQNMLAAHPKPDLILALNDSMALGALKVLNDRHDTGTLVAAAADGQKQALQLMMPPPVGQGCKSQYVATGLNSPSLATTGGLRIAWEVASGKVKASSVKKAQFTESTGINCQNVAKFYDPKSIF
ncbi:sugar ABC transporter substrate-binding protein [Streptomyces sp. MMS24-I2-30]|uniref:sugar ABC transporter substrate-binding protein n=1 Tax=Streptomyces sp. MMS24-I2-30 TaxID=3351564 RepID=UPI003896BD3C